MLYRIRNAFICVVAALGIGRMAAYAADAPPRPNVVIIMADDMGYGDLGCYGATKISTPHCDRLAREGRRFTDAHSASASCSPTRFGLLTGGYPWRDDRVPGALTAAEAYKLRPGEATIANVLKKAGYATACIGKWHLGTQNKKPVDWNQPLTPGPNTAGFDYFYGVINSHNHPPFVLVENEKILGLEPGEKISIKGEREQTEGRRLRDENALEAQCAAKAVEFIEQNKDRPFFLYYPASAVHDPYTPGQAWQGKSQAGIYGDYVQEFDWAVGEVLAALDRNKLADNTIVLVLSDNGAQDERGAEYGHKANGDLRGMKGTAWEGGHRLQYLLRWPGKVPAGTTCDETISQVDSMATLCAALEIPLPAGAGPDSYNVLPAWLGQKTEKPIRDNLVAVGRSVFCVRQGPWVLLTNLDSKTRTKGGFTEPEMYNLASDPRQQDNLIKTMPDKAKELNALLEKIRTQGYTRPGWETAKQ
jgi:arylsulfatase A